ncbi:MAG: cytochrome c5 family protein [Legionella sp.]|nr:MAG: cytochrome c5 family protein [Legionella sp.]
MNYNAFWILLTWSTSLWPATHHPQAFLDKISGTKTEGEEVVKHFCATCHATHPLIPLGAPRMGIANDWVLRLKQGKAVLFQHTADGFGAMPARGGCFECSDVQLKRAIAVLVSTP